MKNSVKVLSTLVCVEFLLYTVCLCAPQWLVRPGGACEGLFAVCDTYEGMFSCTTLPAWMGSAMVWGCAKGNPHFCDGTINAKKCIEILEEHILSLSKEISPKFTGSFSLTWMFLASSSTLSLATLAAIKPALSKGKRAIVALLLNVISVAFCVCALIAFMLSIEEHLPEMVKFLGWAFYICCATVLYASVVSVSLGLVGGSSSVEPVSPHDCSGLPPMSP